MPKGVEHYGDDRKLTQRWLVREPQMPKGVEHYFVAILSALQFAGARTSDAERR